MKRLSQFVTIGKAAKPAASGKVTATAPGGKYSVDIGGRAVVVTGAGLSVGASVQLRFSDGGYQVIGSQPGVFRKEIVRVKVAG